MSFESLGLLGLFISAFISSTIAPGGSEAVLAYMVNQNVAALIDLVLIATVGNTLGAWTTYWLGSWTVNKYPSKLQTDTRHQRALLWLKRWGYWTLLFSWLPLIGDGLCFASGWLKLSLIRSLLAIMAGKFLRYCAVAYAFL